MNVLRPFVLSVANQSRTEAGLKETSTTAKLAAEQFKQEHTCSELNALFVLPLTSMCLAE